MLHLGLEVWFYLETERIGRGGEARDIYHSSWLPWIATLE